MLSGLPEYGLTKTGTILHGLTDSLVHGLTDSLGHLLFGRQASLQDKADKMQQTSR